jgi:hypothetical protein
VSLMYATVDDLASFLQKDIDTATATLNIQVASAMFSARANTWFNSVTYTYQTQALGYRQLQLPFRPVTAVSAVRIVSAATGVTTTITDYTRIKTVLYRLIGFGVPGIFPPDMVEVDLTYGFATVPDDVRGAVLETAAAGYQGPDVTVVSEQIDDYRIQMAPNTGGVSLTPSAAKLADFYRGTLAA